MQETNLIEAGQPVEAVANETIAPPAPSMTLCSYGKKAYPGGTGPSEDVGRHSRTHPSPALSLSRS